MVSLLAAAWLLPAHAEAPDPGTESTESVDFPSSQELEADMGEAFQPVRPPAREVASGDTVGFSSSTGAPEYYTVQTGDTLWDISSKFLGNPYYWPRLWSINEQITNPHWIYPGNRIRFTPGTLLEPPDVGLETEPGRDGYTVAGMSFGDSELVCGPDVRFNTSLPSTTYQSLGFLADKDDVDILGEVPRARAAMSLLGENDLIYLDLESPDAYECGDPLLIFRPVVKKVKHPEQRRTKYGTLYQVVGEARVVHRSGKYVSARVRTSYSEIQRGDLIGPMLPTTVELEVEEPNGDVEGIIVARLNQEAVLGRPGETVFLDRGRADGLRVGSSLYVVEQRDLLINPNKDDEELPQSVVGRVVVVRIDEYWATAVITDAASPIDVGNRLAQRVD